MAKVTKVPPFVQISATSWSVSVREVRGVPVPIFGTVLYGLDKKGRVWRKVGSNYAKHWHLLPDEAGAHPEQEES